MQFDDIINDKWWLDIGLEFTELKIAHDSIFQFFEHRFGTSHTITKLFGNFKLINIWDALDDIVCKYYPTKICQLPSYPMVAITEVFSNHNAKNKYKLIKDNRMFGRPIKGFTTYEKNIIYSLINNFINYISNLKEYEIFYSNEKLMKCCKILLDKIYKFIIVFDNVFVNENRNEIATKKELEKYPIGSAISHMTINSNFKSGGFITKFCKDYFIYILPDFVTKYKARYENISKIWVGNVYATENDIVSIIPSKRKKTKCAVIINDIAIFYGTEYDCILFKNSKKYKMIMKWYQYFG